MFRNPFIDAAVVLVALLLIFGPKRLPLLGRSLGTGMREFKDSISGDSSDEADRPALTESTAAPVAAAPAPQRESVPLDPGPSRS